MCTNKDIIYIDIFKYIWVDKERRKISPILIWEERKIQGLISAWKDDGADPPGNDVKAYGKQEGDW